MKPRCLSVLFVMLLLGYTITAAANSQSCTVFLATDGASVFAGNNEDVGYLPGWIALLPPEPEAYGRFIVGIEGIPQGGMNDQGLFFDCLTMPEVWVLPCLGKSLPEGIFTLEILESCATIEEVLAYLDEHQLPGIHEYQYVFGDRTGHSFILEGNTVIPMEGSFQVCTNFRQSQVPKDEIRCRRFLTANSMLASMNTLTIESCRDVLEAVHFAPDGSFATLYSTIYDLISCSVSVYFLGDYENPLVFTLSEALSDEPQILLLADLFPDRDEYTAWEESEYARFERRLARRLPEEPSTAVYDEFVGHYTLAPFTPPIPYPPVTVREMSIVREDERLYLVVDSAGTAFELFPGRSTDLVHVNLSGNPPGLGLTLARSWFWGTPRLELNVAGIATWQFRRVSDEPEFTPLFQTAFPVPDYKELSRAEPNKYSKQNPSIPGWIVVAGILLGFALTRVL